MAKGIHPTKEPLKDPKRLGHPETCECLYCACYWAQQKYLRDHKEDSTT